MNGRRTLVVAGLGSLLLRPAAATPEAMRAALAAFTGGAPLRDGKVTLEIAALVENSNTVPVSVHVASPMSAADHVQRIALFTERNPEPGVAVFHLGPRSGRAEVATRMRLATSQTVLAVAQMNDGSCWRSAVEVIVTIPACSES
jgi:sulfur-oxidizing protein SoxY